jgi:glycerol-3-phosphate dehydrogenase
MNRSTSLDRIRSSSEPFDVLIVGGGATGLGAAVDAAARGYRVALIEQHDFAKGTSSRSTKLVHGGVRYLRQGNISLVLEALRERGRLALNAPHLVHDLAFVIPSYKWWEGPFYGIGLKVYDQLAGKLGLEPSRMLSRKETIKLIPTVEPEHLTGGVVYHDGQFDDSRLAVNLAQTAYDLGGAVTNYCRCVNLIKKADIVTGVVARDQESGEEFTIRARSVVNATGVFVDDLRRLDDKASKRLVAVSQGIHIVLPKAFLPGSTAIMIPKTADGRVLFAVPWHDRVVVGTTDTPLSGHSLEPRALDEERDFVMSHACRYLAKGPSDGDVLSIFAGQRPLVAAGGASSTAALSRDHTILVSSSGLITITGGKWTTYRKMAEDVIDQAATIAGVESARSRTEDMRVHGWTQAKIREKNLQPYGSDAVKISELIKATPALGRRLHPALPYQQGEVVWQVRHEMARCVEDVLARRTRALILNAAASIEAAPLVARLVAAELGYDGAWQARQVSDYTALARGYVFTDPASHRQPEPGDGKKRASARAG